MHISSMPLIKYAGDGDLWKGYSNLHYVWCMRQNSYSAHIQKACESWKSCPLLPIILRVLEVLYGCRLYYSMNSMAVRQSD